MWHILPTEKWIDEVVKFINDNHLEPKSSKFMMAFFSSMDTEFVDYFKNNEKQISSFSGSSFHIFTPLIYEDKFIPDGDWRFMRNEFNNMGIPVHNEPTFVFFSLKAMNNGLLEPTFFAGFECASFQNFNRKMKYAINTSIAISDTQRLAYELASIFQSPNIIPVDNVDYHFKETIMRRLPKSKVFISHSSNDKPFVNKLVSALSTDHNLSFWIDENEIKAGTDIQKVISQSLKDSDYLLIIISESSIKSNWVNFEITQFMGFSDNQKIIPIKLSKDQDFPEPLNNLLRRLKYIDFSDGLKWEKNIETLKCAIQEK